MAALYSFSISFCLFLLLLDVACTSLDNPDSENKNPRADEGLLIPTNVFHAFNDAGGVIGNVFKKIFTNRRIVGIDSDWLTKFSATK